MKKLFLLAVIGSITLVACREDNEENVKPTKYAKTKQTKIQAKASASQEDTDVDPKDIIPPRR